MGGVAVAVTIDCADLTTREINRRIRSALAEGAEDLTLRNPAGRHNLAVALESDVNVTFEGTVGYFVGALGMGPNIVVNGNAGWSVGADIMAGGVHVLGNAGSSVGASIRGGTIAIDGDVGARAGIALKGGAVVIGGNAGYMTGFMMQTGTIVIGGNAADGLGDSMYAGDIFVGGDVASLGADGIMREATDEEVAGLRVLLVPLGHDPDRAWKHVTSKGDLWHFEKEKYELWKEAF